MEQISSNIDVKIEQTSDRDKETEQISSNRDIET